MKPLLIAIFLIALGFTIGRITITAPATAAPTDAQLQALRQIDRDLQREQKLLGGNTISGMNIHDLLREICITEHDATGLTSAGCT